MTTDVCGTKSLGVFVTSGKNEDKKIFQEKRNVTSKTKFGEKLKKDFRTNKSKILAYNKKTQNRGNRKYKEYKQQNKDGYRGNKYMENNLKKNFEKVMIT